MIKRTFLAVALITAFAFSANAQASFALGLKAGLNFANIDATEAPGETLKSSTGFHFGAFSTIKFSKLAVQPEILFSKQGSVSEVTGVGDLKTSLNYVNVPVMLKLYLAGGLNLQVGPQFGFLTSATSDIDTGGGVIAEQDIKDFLKGSDVSVNFGAGVDLPFGLTVDARYNLGVSDINDFTGATESIKNKVFQISVGYKFIDMGK